VQNGRFIYKKTLRVFPLGLHVGSGRRGSNVGRNRKSALQDQQTLQVVYTGGANMKHYRRCPQGPPKPMQKKRESSLGGVHL